MQTSDVVKFLKSKDFIFIKNIGQGGTGSTVLLRDETINEDFICKKYSPYNPEDKALYYNNFVDEIKILYKINHPNIVRVFNYYLYPEKTTGFIIMEYIDGLNIEDYLLSKPDKINDVFIQTIEGFKYLEEKNILHRDIRPNNILVSNDGTVKIIDFGFGKNIKSIKDYGKSITLNWAYSLPNEFNESIYDLRTEIYFVGKLFEQIINKKNYDFFFKYPNLLSNMTNIDYQNRISSFFDVSRQIISNNSLEIKFGQKERKIYSNIADAFTQVCIKMDYTTSYIKDFNIIQKRLEDLYQNSILEKFIQNNNYFISCFVEKPFTYQKKKIIPVDFIQAFLEWIYKLSENDKKIILNNLWQRFDNIERKSDYDLPF